MPHLLDALGEIRLIRRPQIPHGQYGQEQQGEQKHRQVRADPAARSMASNGRVPVVFHSPIFAGGRRFPKGLE